MILDDSQHEFRCITILLILKNQHNLGSEPRDCFQSHVLIKRCPQALCVEPGCQPAMARRKRLLDDAGLSRLDPRDPDFVHVRDCWRFIRQYNPHRNKSQAYKYRMFEPFLSMLAESLNTGKISNEKYFNELDLVLQWSSLSTRFLKGKIFKVILRGKSRHHGVIRNIRDMCRERSRSRVHRSRSHHTRRRGHTRRRQRYNSRDRRSRCHDRCRSKHRCDHKEGHNNRRSCGHKIRSESSVQMVVREKLSLQRDKMHLQRNKTPRGIDYPKGLSPFSPSRQEVTEEKNESSNSKASPPEDKTIDPSKDCEYSYSYSYYSESDEPGIAPETTACTATENASNAAAAGSTSHSESIVTVTEGIHVAATSHSQSATDEAGAIGAATSHSKSATDTGTASGDARQPATSDSDDYSYSSDKED